MLISVVRDIQRLLPESKITVLAENPDFCGVVAEQINVPIKKSLNLFVQAVLNNLTSGEKPAITILKLANQILLLKNRIVSGQSVQLIPPEFVPGLCCLMNSHGVIDCGGASLTPLWKSYFYEKCLDYILAAKPLFITGQGIDPFDEEDDVQLLVYALSQANEITLREKFSEEYLRSIGCKAFFHTTGDDALTLQPSSYKRAKSLLRSAGLDNSKPYLACQYRRFDFFDIPEDLFLNIYIRYVDEAISITGLPVVGIPMNFGGFDERKLLREIAEGVRHNKMFYIIEDHITPGDAKSLFSMAQMTFGIAYHGAIFSLSSGTPFLGLYTGAHYAQKMHGLSQLYGLPQLPVPLASCEVAEFRRVFKNMFDNRKEISTHLKIWHRDLLKQVVDTRERFIHRIM